LVLVADDTLAEPFETDEEVAEFLRWANQKWLDNESW
jgi:hypothetical protein